MVHGSDVMDGGLVMNRGLVMDRGVVLDIDWGGCGLMKVMRCFMLRVSDSVLGLNRCLDGSLDDWLEVQITMGDITVQRLAIKLMVLASGVDTVDLWVMVHGGLMIAFVSVTVVDVSNRPVVILVSNSPRVHVGVLTSEVGVLVANTVQCVLVRVDNATLVMVSVSRLLNVGGGALMVMGLDVMVVLGAVSVGLVSVMVVLRVSINNLIEVNVAMFLSMERKSLVGHIVVLNSMLGL